MRCRIMRGWHVERKASCGVCLCVCDVRISHLIPHTHPETPPCSYSTKCSHFLSFSAYHSRHVLWFLLPFFSSSHTALLFHQNTINKLTLLNNNALLILQQLFSFIIKLTPFIFFFSPISITLQLTLPCYKTHLSRPFFASQNLISLRIYIFASTIQHSYHV